MQTTHVVSGRLAHALSTNKLAQLGEFATVFLVGAVVVVAGMPVAGDDPLRRQAVFWIANVLMLVTVWSGLRLRGQTFEHFGLSFRRPDRSAVVRALWQSVVVFVAAVAAFVTGAILMANIVGMPEGADLSGYSYLEGNLPMLLLALAGVYIVSSFGEEVLYRGFLMNRIAEMGAGTKSAWIAAVVISTIVFGLIHSEWAVTGMVQTGFMGLAMAAAYLMVRRNLWVLVLAHGYADTLLLVPLYFGAE